MLGKLGMWRQYRYIGKLPNDDIPVFWDSKGDRYIKISPYPAGTVDRHGRLIPGVMVDDGHGRKVVSDRIYQNCKARWYHAGKCAGGLAGAALLGIVIFAQFADSSNITFGQNLLALALGWFFGGWAVRACQKGPFANGYVIEASPREVLMAAYHSAYRYEMGRTPLYWSAPAGIVAACYYMLMVDYHPNLVPSWLVPFIFVCLAVFDIVWLVTLFRLRRPAAEEDKALGLVDGK